MCLIQWCVESLFDKVDDISLSIWKSKLFLKFTWSTCLRFILQKAPIVLVFSEVIECIQNTKLYTKDIKMNQRLASLVVIVCDLHAYALQHQRKFQKAHR